MNYVQRARMNYVENNCIHLNMQGYVVLSYAFDQQGLSLQKQFAFV